MNPNRTVIFKVYLDQVPQDNNFKVYLDQVTQDNNIIDGRVLSVNLLISLRRKRFIVQQMMYASCVGRPKIKYLVHTYLRKISETSCCVY